MSREDFEELQGGKFKRKVKRRLGLFIDGIGLDRATRRLERKVDLAQLVAGLTSGLKPEIARYYTLVPYEDDARQFAFLDAVERAGLKVIVKRLPPKGVKRQVSMDVHMASDLIAYSYGTFDDGKEPMNDNEISSEAGNPTATPVNGSNGHTESENLIAPAPKSNIQVKRLAVMVCPNRELSYAIDLSHRIQVETTLADFGLYGSSDGWRGVDRWVDLSTSETIWR